MIHSQRPQRRRGFNLVEMLIALAVSSALLMATMMSLDASFTAYQTTTEVASTHTISRLAMHRILALVRTGTEFAPTPDSTFERLKESDFIDFRMPNGSVMTIQYTVADETLYIETGGETYPLLEGVIPQYDPPSSTDEDDRIRPFTLEYDRGRVLYRATVDLVIIPDDNMSVELDGDSAESLHLVATAMPRNFTSEYE